MNLAQVGSAIHDARTQAGLLQAQVAKFAGLSRVTVNQLENGTLNDLGYTKLKAVMDVVGLDMATVQPSQLKSALAVVARSISTSYREVVGPELLKSMLRSGQAPEQFQPHLMALLDETPLPLVVKAIGEAATPDVPVKKILQHLQQWAHEWKACRTIW
jgi:transcriptional regulator with XRE-family HTH domain